MSRQKGSKNKKTIARERFIKIIELSLSNKMVAGQFFKTRKLKTGN